MPTDTPAAHLDTLERRLQEALDLVRRAKRTELTPTRWLTASAELGGLVAEVRLASGEVRQSLLGGARTAVLAYLRQRVGETVPAASLGGVSGIREWARRIRELREAGWDIECLGSGADAPYRLSADRLDESVAGSDDLIARIKVGKPKERLIEYLVHVSPWLVSGTRLREVARSETWRDDLQALRDEGWPIQTHGDDPAIPPGYFRLARLGD
jgi:hypothetical protein